MSKHDLVRPGELHTGTDLKLLPLILAMIGYGLEVDLVDQDIE